MQVLKKAALPASRLSPSCSPVVIQARQNRRSFMSISILVGESKAGELEKKSGKS
jgi:hypothetical protein